MGLLLVLIKLAKLIFNLVFDSVTLLTLVFFFFSHPALLLYVCVCVGLGGWGWGRVRVLVEQDSKKCIYMKAFGFIQLTASFCSTEEGY